jgi:hypothetical protein
VNDRLIRAAGLKIVETDQLHVAHFRPLLGRHAGVQKDGGCPQGNPDRRNRQMPTFHVSRFQWPSVARAARTSVARRRGDLVVANSQDGLTGPCGSLVQGVAAGGGRRDNEPPPLQHSPDESTRREK